jgi:hypothetical protein
MKAPQFFTFVAIVSALILNASGQGFVNCDFEDSVISNGTYGGLVATLTGWTTYGGDNYVDGDPNTVPYNDIALDAPAVDLEGANNSTGPVAIQGNYSVLLQGGSRFVPNTGGASIGQTGQIPANAQSLIYWGASGNGLIITFGGHVLSFVTIDATPNYTIWGADVSAYSGQTGQLLFNAPWESAGLLDNIQFSSTSVPEPSVFNLFGVCVIWLFTKWPNIRIGAMASVHCPA